MADITNLSNFLGDIASAIREKKGTTEPIPAQEFDSEIATIETGVDTNDATAGADDIINPKTAYVNGTKITGRITAEYSTQGEVALDDTTITSSSSLTYQTMDISTTAKVCVKYITPNLTLYKIVDGVVDYDNPITYTNTDLSITSTVGFGRPKFAPTLNGDGTINLVIVVVQDGAGGVPFYIHLYKVNPETLEVTHSTVNSNAMYTGNKYHWLNSTTKAMDVAFSGSDKFFIGTVYSAEVGSWDNATGYFRYAHLQIIDETTLTVLKSTTHAIGAAGHGQGWGNNYPRFKMFFQDGYLQVYEEKNYRGTSGTSCLNLYTYWSMFLKESDYSFFYKTMTESTRHIYVECNGYIIGNGKSFKVTDRNTVVATHDFTPAYAHYVGVMGKNVLWISSNACRIYGVGDDGSVQLKNTVPATFGQYDNDNVNFIVQNSGIISILKIDKIITALNRQGVKYLTTLDATVKANEMLEGKKAYSNNILMTGTMPNNGALNYTPTTENQTIPLGYTDGGIVTGDANLLPENIKENVSLFGIRGTATVLDTYDATATSADILAPKIAYANGTQVVGSIETVYEGTGFVEDATLTKSADWQDISMKAKLALYFNGSGLRIGFINDGTITTLKTFSATDLGTGTINTGRAIFFTELQSDTSIRILVVSSTSSSGTANYYAGIYELDFSNLDDIQIELVSIRTQVLYHTGDNQLCAQFGEKLAWVDSNTCMLGATSCPGGGYNNAPLYFRHVNIDINGTEITTSKSKATWLAGDVYADAWGGRMSRVDCMHIEDGYMVSVISKSYRSGNSGLYYYITVFTDLETNTDYYKRMTSDIGFVIKDGLVYGNNNVYSLTALDTSLATISLSFNATREKANVGEDYFMVVGGNLCIYRFSEYEPILQSTYNNYDYTRLSSDTVWAVSTGTTILTFKVEQSVYAMIRNGATYNITTDATAAASDIVAGKTAYVGGEKITGTIQELADMETDTTVTVIAQHENGNVWVRQSLPIDYLLRTTGSVVATLPASELATVIGLTPENIKKGVTILGVTGTYEPNYEELGTVTPEEYETAVNTAIEILGEEVTE